MYYGDAILFNDEQRARLKTASRKAAQGWRFRHVKGPGVRLLGAAVQAASALAHDLVEATRRKTERTSPRRPLTLTGQN
jgi:hypothetical protein